MLGGQLQRSWSTDSVKSGKAFSYWREVVREAVLNVSTEASCDGFRARISCRGFDSLRFVGFDSTSHSLVRTSEHLSRAPADNYLVSLQRRGQSCITQGNASLVLEPGEIAIVDGQRPFRIDFPQPVSRTIAVVPRNMLDSRASWLRKISGARKITAETPFSDLIRRHLIQLADNAENLRGNEVSALTDNLCNLLAIGSARDVPPGRWRTELQLDAILAFCRQNLSDRKLSPQLLASRFDISVRMVHLRFRDVGQTFGRWLLENRLHACSQALRDSRCRAMRICDIAYQWGFGDMSHFNKSFRAQFGMAPGEWRATHEISASTALGCKESL